MEQDIVERLETFRRKMVAQSEEPELYALLGDAIERLRRAPPAGEVVAKALAALEEAEAILGGEYGDHYAVLCQQMIDLRAALSTSSPPSDRNAVIEECAKVAEGSYTAQGTHAYYRQAARTIAIAIRALKENDRNA